MTSLVAPGIQEINNPLPGGTWANRKRAWLRRQPGQWRSAVSSRCAAVDRYTSVLYITNENCSCSDYRLVSDPNEYRILMYAAVGSRACYCHVNKIQETYIPLDQRYPRTH